jgi:hypothetical protein
VSLHRGRRPRWAGPSALLDGMPREQDSLMQTLSAELLLTVALFILLAVAAGTLTARLFLAASRSGSSGAGPRDEL